QRVAFGAPEVPAAQRQGEGERGRRAARDAPDGGAPATPSPIHAPRGHAVRDGEARSPMNKPYWPRTLHLLPAHLQARDAYVEALLTLRTRWSVSDAYGVIDLAVDEAAGARGELVIQRLDAVFASGLVVHVDPASPLRRSAVTASTAPSLS